MPSVKKPAAPEEMVHCAVCGKEIPRSAAVVPQNKDYVYYYCGQDCYRKAAGSPSP
jgi:YHS domain-containing protein